MRYNPPPPPVCSYSPSRKEQAHNILLAERVARLDGGHRENREFSVESENVPRMKKQQIDFSPLLLSATWLWPAEGLGRRKRKKKIAVCANFFQTPLFHSASVHRVAAAQVTEWSRRVVGGSN